MQRTHASVTHVHCSIAELFRERGFRAWATQVYWPFLHPQLLQLHIVILS